MKNKRNAGRKSYTDQKDVKYRLTTVMMSENESDRLGGREVAKNKVLNAIKNLK